MNSTATDTRPAVRRLVFLDAPPAARCPVCGFNLDAPGEAVQHLGSLAHVACAESDAAAMRGGA